MTFPDKNFDGYEGNTRVEIFQNASVEAHNHGDDHLDDKLSDLLSKMVLWCRR